MTRETWSSRQIRRNILASECSGERKKSVPRVSATVKNKERDGIGERNILLRPLLSIYVSVRTELIFILNRIQTISSVQRTFSCPSVHSNACEPLLSDVILDRIILLRIWGAGIYFAELCLNRFSLLFFFPMPHSADLNFLHQLRHDNICVWCVYEGWIDELCFSTVLSKRISLWLTDNCKTAKHVMCPEEQQNFWKF